jgi:protein O-mannosyl-transferase
MSKKRKINKGLVSERPSIQINRESAKIETTDQRYKVLICIFLIFINLVVFGQSLGHEFIGFDDDKYIYENSSIIAGLTAKAVAWSFTTFKMGHWHPLTWLSYLLDTQLFGQHPAGYHFTNILIHIANSLILFLLLNYLTSALWRSAIVAALFAIHPLHVETVAWISSRKDLLSSLFGFLSIWAYAYYVRNSLSWKRYILVFFTLALSLMSKSMLVTLPFVFLLLDYWPLRRFGIDNLKNSESIKKTIIPLFREKLPLFALSAVILFVAFAAKGQGSAVVSLNQEVSEISEVSEARELSEARPEQSVMPYKYIKVAVAVKAYISYLYKMFLPRGLSIYYPYEIYHNSMIVIGLGLLLLLITILIVRKAERYPYMVVGWLWYLGILVPVIFLLQADKYTYVSLIGLFLIIVWGVGDALGNWQYGHSAKKVLAGVSIIALATCAWFQTRLWRDSKTLFEHAIAVTKENVIMHNNLGNTLLKKGEIEEAGKHYSEALRLNPNFAEAHNNLATVFMKQGDLEKAARYFEQTLNLKPENAVAHKNLGNVYLKQGKLDEASKYYNEALRLQPNSAEVHNNLGLIFLSENKLNDAEAHFTEAIRIRPNYPQAHCNLGKVLFRKGDSNAAKNRFTEALRLDPKYAEARINLQMVNKAKNANDLLQEKLRDFKFAAGKGLNNN